MSIKASDLATSEMHELIKKHGLTIISTGGGFDYPYFAQGCQELASEGESGEFEGPQFVVETTMGETPLSVREPVNVILFTDRDWQDYISLPFDDAASALAAVRDPAFRAAAHWLTLELQDEDRVEFYINTFYPFTKEQEQLYDEQDLSHQEIAEKTLRDFGVELITYGNGRTRDLSIS